MNRTQTFLAALLVALAPVVTSHARGISWSSGVGDNFLKADGVTNMDGTFTFELGGFLSSFTPTLANLSLWQTNWVVFDSVVDGNGWNPALPFSNYSNSVTAVAGSGSNITSSDTGQTFTIGQQAYIWTFNSKSLDVGSEWSLIKNTVWTYPTADPFNPNDLQWTLSDVGNTAVAGATSTDGNTFVSTLQTQAVPEPGSALLIAVAGVVIRLRRRFGR